ncbi:uncharacterized protein LOC143448938 isoform X2 [Clavelina lepadiformis]|uniref:uncharacterized protein LOC143448938 isoform X2 n=1 Tax=Clavelina lepadiformis TaxID=159417 RepID=UPI0040415689
MDLNGISIMSYANRSTKMKRKKSKNSDTSERPLRASSSTDSEDFSSSAENARRVTLHVITDPGQSEKINSSFQDLIRRLNLTFDVICVSERFKPINHKDSKNNSSSPDVPAIAVVLFFNDGFNIEKQNDTVESDTSQTAGEKEEPIDTTSRINNMNEVRNIFRQKPWRFHHKVAVSGKLISCDSNEQDYYEYNYHDAFMTPQTLNTGRRTPFGDTKPLENLSCSKAAFPLWGVRKVHYGKQILRFTIFVSQENWDDQINLYKLILRADETQVRDDFCYFLTYSNTRSVIQIGLKKLPPGLKPEPLTSTILQFKIKNVGQLVPLLPYACDPISELRWRTRDHDSNLILLQIYRTQGVSAGSSFMERVFTDQESSDSPGKTPKTIASAVDVIPRSKKNGRSTPSSSVSSTKSSSHDGEKVGSGARSFGKETSVLGDSFLCPSLPEKMPLLKTVTCIPTKYFLNTSSCSSVSSIDSSEHVSSLTSSSRSPERHSSVSSIPSSTPRIINERHPKVIRSGRLSVTNNPRNLPDNFESFHSTSSPKEGEYYV